MTQLCFVLCPRLENEMYAAPLDDAEILASDRALDIVRSSAGVHLDVDWAAPFKLVNVEWSKFLRRYVVRVETEDVAAATDWLIDNYVETPDDGWRGANHSITREGKMPLKDEEEEEKAWELNLVLTEGFGPGDMRCWYSVLEESEYGIVEEFDS